MENKENLCIDSNKKTGLMFAGIVKTSFVDYPGKICSTVFTCGCNFNCEYCQNSGLINPLPGSGYVSQEYVLEYLSTKAKLIDGLVITGGEPSLHLEDLIPFIEKVREITPEGFKIKIDTNGSNVLFTKLMTKMVDFIAIDFKSMDYKSFGGGVNYLDVLDSIEVLKYDKKIDYEVRITMYPKYVKEDMFEEISEVLSGVKKVAVQQYIPKPGMEHPYSENILENFKSMLSKTVVEVVIRNV